MDYQSLFAPGGIVPSLSQLGQDVGSAFRDYNDIRAKRDAAQQAKDAFQQEMAFKQDQARQAQMQQQQAAALHQQQLTQSFQQQRDLQANSENAAAARQEESLRAGQNLEYARNDNDMLRQKAAESFRREQAGRATDTAFQQLGQRERFEAGQNEATRKNNMAMAQVRAVDPTWHTTPHDKLVQMALKSAYDTLQNVAASDEEKSAAQEAINTYGPQAGGEAPAGTGAPGKKTKSISAQMKANPGHDAEAIKRAIIDGGFTPVP